MEWENEILVFEKEDEKNFPEAGQVLFYGSSSIRLWETITQDFPDLKIMRRGFGGARLDEMIACLPRIVIPYKPKQVVIYLGGNDIAARRPADYVVAKAEEMAGLIHDKYPDTEVFFIEIFYHPRFKNFFDVIKNVNEKLKQLATVRPNIIFIPVNHLISDPACFQEDQIHLSRKGYNMLTQAVMPFLKI